MPWKTGGPGGKEIIRADTGKVVGHSTSHKKAAASVRARYANTSGRDAAIHEYNKHKRAHVVPSPITTGPDMGY